MQQRERVAEIMDDPQLDASRHLAALRDLGRLNRFSLSARSLWGPITTLARQQALSRLTILDVAAGGADNGLALCRRAERHGLRLEIHAVDFSQRALRFARQQSEAAGVPMRFSALDVLEADLPSGYDVVLSSLFLHHLEESQIVRLLKQMDRAATRLVVIHDLRRCRRGLALAFTATRLLTRSPVVRTDALRSVKAAFTAEEMHQLARQAGLADFRLKKCWPLRLLLSWQPTGSRRQPV